MQQNFKTIIFDLDGTLIDSAQEILLCLQTAFQECTPTHILSNDILQRQELIGPPLDDLIQTLGPKLTPVQAQQVQNTFQRIYDTSDYLQTCIYPGIYDLLQNLIKAKIQIFLATNKRHQPTHRILSLKKLNCFTEVICTDTFHPQKMTKSAMIHQLLTRWQLKQDTTLMVGDTAHDINAAHQNQILAAAVLYGYGSVQSIHDSNPDFLLKDIAELHQLIL